MTRQLVTVAEAAELLGISQDAVRMRFRRGKLDGEKDRNRLHVWVDTDATADATAPRDELLESYRDQVEFLRRELERRDRLLAAALERIPALEAPPEPSGSPETATVDADEGRGEEYTERRPWWRRIINP